MTDSPRSLLDYQREISAISGTRAAKPGPSEVPEIPAEDAERDSEPKWGFMAATLRRAGWSHVVRGPKRLRIWCENPSDWKSRWKSEEAAYKHITEGEA